MQSFLTIPTKRAAEPLTDLPARLKSYIREHFNDVHPDNFTEDIEGLLKLRRNYVDGADGPEVHPEVLNGLYRCGLHRRRAPEDGRLTLSSRARWQISSPTCLLPDEIPAKCVL